MIVGLQCARGVRASASRLPQAVAFIHSARLSSAPTQSHTLPSASGALAARVQLRDLRVAGVRAYATDAGKKGGKEESAQELLDRLTREARSKGRAFDATHEHVGPFPLGVGPSGRNKTWKSWSDLNLGGKLVRTVRQSGNLLVVVFGAGLFLILTLALTTELFAKNSPAVLYSECIDMIRDTDALAPFLLPPLKFTHTPNSASPTRGSNPVVHRTVRSPYSGKDHLLLTFWVHGRGKDDPEPHPVRHWLKDKWDDFYAWAQDKGGWLGLATDPDTPEPADDKVAQEERKQDGWLASLANSLSLRPRGQRQAPALPPPGTFTIGECVADYVKDENGQYQMLSLVVDVPSARAQKPYQAVVYMSPAAGQEGLVNRR